jgi:pimeloyl-ACP methyl ester carboxylesterase
MRRLRRVATSVLIGAVVLWAGATAGLWAMQERLIFPGWAGPTAAQVAAVPGLAEVVTPGPGGVGLRAWYRPADPGRPTVILFHGNAGFQWPKLTALADRGYGLYLTAYRGFAGNPGTPSAEGLLADGSAALDYALGAWAIAPEETVLYGESLGTGVAARMALEPGAWRALVLDAPYTVLSERAAEMYPILPVRRLIRHDFDTLSIIDRIETPLLILHGTDDFIIPVSHGRALLTQAEAPKRGVWIEGEDHFLPADRVAGEVEAFLEATAP